MVSGAHRIVYDGVYDAAAMLAAFAPEGRPGENWVVINNPNAQTVCIIGISGGGLFT